MEQVLQELQHYPEAWSGIELTPVIAYGFRVYRNNSHLNMHLDKPGSHIISLILHIDHSIDSEPWPVTIEDFNGSEWRSTDSQSFLFGFVACVRLTKQSCSAAICLHN